MGKERLDDIIKMGHDSERCLKASTFEIEMAKLITAATIMPSMNVGVDFYINDEDGLDVMFYQNGHSGHKFLTSVVELDAPSRKKQQLFRAIYEIHNHMEIEGILSQDDCLSQNDDILWSALDDTADRTKFVPNGVASVLDSVGDSALRINTLRKMLNFKSEQGVSEYESLLTTILGLIDYYTNSNNPDNPLSRMSVNTRTYFRDLDDFDCVNRAIIDNCTGEKDVALNNFIAARTPLEDRKAAYLAGLYLRKLNQPRFNTSDISVSAADFLVPSASEM